MFRNLKSVALVLGMCVLAVTLCVGCNQSFAERYIKQENGVDVESESFRNLTQNQQDEVLRYAKENNMIILGNGKRY